MYSSLSSDPAERAKALLLHYLSNAADGKNPKSDRDCISEVGSIIDDAVEAAIRQAEARIQKRLDELDRALSELA